MTRCEQVNSGLRVLLADYGYRLTGSTLIALGVRGFVADTIFRRNVRSLLDATEILIPIVRDDEFYSRYKRITAE